MRKQTKIAALVSAAALLTIGAAMTSFAGKWDIEGDQWVYLDNDGTKVENEWKSSYGTYYYLGEDGYMATNQIVGKDEDDTYYVGADGRRVTNTWISVPNEEDETANGEEVDTLWYYFGANGKAYKYKDSENDNTVVKKSVPWSGGTNTFFFDENGHMAHGWLWYTDVDGKENIYYLGDENEGWARAEGKNGSTGWELLEPHEEMEPNVDPEITSYEDEEWFYFQSSGKAYRADPKKEAKTVSKYINGYYYTFDVNGVLQTKWFNAASPAATGSTAYTGLDGVKAGWVYTTTKHDEDSNAWYYLINVGDNKAMAFGAHYSGDDPSTIEKYAKWYTARTIGGKTYLFDGLGRMKSGIVKIGANDLWTKWNGQTTNIVRLNPGVYYFSKAAASQGDDGHMLYGKQKYVTDEGETQNYYLAKATGTMLDDEELNKGQAYTNCLVDGYLYGSDGVRIEPQDGNKYEIIDVAYDPRFEKTDADGDKLSGTGYVSIKLKNGWVTYDEPDVKFIIGSNGKVKSSKTVTYDDIVYVIDDYTIRYHYLSGASTADKETAKANAVDPTDVSRKAVIGE